MILRNMLGWSPSYSTAVFVMLIGCAFCAQAVATPVITSLQPGIGPVGTEVTILGSGFGSTQGSSTVTFSGAFGMPRSWSDTEIVVPVPEAATSGPVVVTVDGIRSKGLKFVVIVDITSVVPSSACIGTAISIQGSGFGSMQGTSTVTFNGVPATPTAWSATTIEVPVPTGATSGPLVVTVKGKSATVPFTISCN